MEHTCNFFFQKELFYVCPTAFIGELYLCQSAEPAQMRMSTWIFAWDEGWRGNQTAIPGLAFLETLLDINLLVEQDAFKKSVGCFMQKGKFFRVNWKKGLFLKRTGGGGKVITLKYHLGDLWTKFLEFSMAHWRVSPEDARSSHRDNPPY